MDVLTLFVDQGALAGVRIGGEGIIVDAHMPVCENVNPKEIQQSLSLYFRGVDVRGLILTGFDSDHAHDLGVEWILSTFQPAWIMSRSITRIRTVPPRSSIPSTSTNGAALRRPGR